MPAMPIEIITVLLFGGLIIGLVIGIPVTLVLGALGTTFILFLWGPHALFAAASSVFSRADSFLFIAIPMFILMAMVLRYSGIGDDLYKMMHQWIGFLPGGLAIGTILICTIVAAMSGLSGTATLMMGMVALPAMVERGYDKHLAIGSVSAGGSLGILIPPSIPMVIYGIISNTSIGHLFIGGILPGLLLSSGFIAYVAVRASLNKNLAPALPPEERASWREKMVSLKAIVLPMFLIFAVLGSIFFGVTTITEASVIGAVGSILCSVINRRFNWKMLRSSLTDTLWITGMAMWIIFGATAFNAAYIGLGAVNIVRSVMLGLEVSPLVILFMMMFIVGVLGCFMDGTGIIMITLPIFLPIIGALGFDGTWFGVLFVINIEMGLLTPPFGQNLFYMRAVVPKETATMGDIYIAMIPFVMVQIIGLLIVIFFPQIVLWLPSLMLKI